MMAMNLNEWLADVVSQDGTITLYDSPPANFSLMVEKCEQAGLIEFDSVDNRLNITYRLRSLSITPQAEPVASAPDSGAYTLDVIPTEHGGTLQTIRSKGRVVYQNTDKYAHLKSDSGLALPEIELATDLLNTETAALRSQLAKLTAELRTKVREVDTMQDSLDDTEHMVNEARAERDSLKAQLVECNHAHELASTQRDAATELYSGKHSRLEDVKRELEVSRDARKALEKVINAAYTTLTDDRLQNYDKISLAAELLERYTPPQSTTD
jgi:hypothetical protein